MEVSIVIARRFPFCHCEERSDVAISNKLFPLPRWERVRVRVKT